MVQGLFMNGQFCYNDMGELHSQVDRLYVMTEEFCRRQQQTGERASTGDSVDEGYKVFMAKEDSDGYDAKEGFA